MIRAFIKVDPETGEVRGYSECPVFFNENGDEIPLDDVSSQGYLQLEVPLGGSHRDTFAVDLATMQVVVTPYVDNAPRRANEPQYIAAENARKAKAAQRIAALGRPINKGGRVNAKNRAKRPKHAPDAPGVDLSKAGSVYDGR